MGQRRLPSSSMKNRSKPARDWTNRPCNDVSSPQNSYVSDDAFSEDACSENYDLYVSGTFDLDLAVHGSLSDSSPQQNIGFSYSKYEDEMDLVLTSSCEHNILLDAYREKVGSHFTSIDRVSSSDCSNAILVKETQSYLPVSVARGMSSLLSFSSDEDAIYEFTKTDCSLSSSSSSFEDLYEEQDKKKSDSSVCSISSSPSDWNGQDGEVQTPKGRTSTTKEDSSSILLPKVLTGTNSSSNFIKNSCNVDASNGFLQHPLHDSSISKKMPPEDSRDDEEEKNGIQDEFEDEPRASPAPVFSYSPEISLIYGFPSPGVDYFDEDKKVDTVEEDIPNESQLNYHPKKISQRIRFQVKKLIREKIRHSSEQELSSYMPLLENTSASPLNFQTHELVAPLAKKLKGVNTQTAWDLTSCDVVVKEQTPSRPILIRSDHNSSSSSSSSSANAVTNVLSDSSPSLSCFTIDEKEEEQQQENAALERRCTTSSSQEETRQEIIVHNDQDVPPHPSIHRKKAARGMILKTTKSVSTQTSPRANTPSLSTLNLFPVGQLIFDSSIGHGSDATLMKHNLIDKMMIMSRNQAGNHDEKYNSRIGGVTTRTPGFSKSIYKELAECNHQEKPPRNSLPNQQSLNDDDNIKSTKEESKALKFWAMAQRRAKSGSDVHVH